MKEVIEYKILSNPTARRKRLAEAGDGKCEIVNAEHRIDFYIYDDFLIIKCHEPPDSIVHICYCKLVTYAILLDMVSFDILAFDKKLYFLFKVLCVKLLNDILTVSIHGQTDDSIALMAHDDVDDHCSCLHKKLICEVLVKNLIFMKVRVHNFGLLLWFNIFLSSKNVRFIRSLATLRIHCFLL
jgi:hypothetical protein